MTTPLDSETIAKALESLSGWTHRENKLSRQYVFDSFPAAIGCIVQMAFACEQVNHHPEIYQVYNRLNIDLTTHDAGCQVTQKDLDLARAIEAVAQNQSKT
jgi:4a-hydroxytetrahydrobiopterin dehydratase